MGARQVDELANSALVLARSRSGRMAAITVGAPHEYVGEDLVRQLRERLAALGQPGVEVFVQTVAGPPRVLSLEFER